MFIDEEQEKYTKGQVGVFPILFSLLTPIERILDYISEDRSNLSSFNPLGCHIVNYEQNHHMGCYFITSLQQKCLLKYTV